MNKSKSSNPVRLIAFFLTAFLLICTFGFTADGWQVKEDKDTSDNSDLVIDFPSDNPDEEQPTDDNQTEKPEVYIPEFTNRLTGLESDEELAASRHLAFIMDPSLPTYGISGADLICEVPTENGTRLVVFASEKQKLWKIGALTQTRGYISNIAKYFGGVCVSFGSDDNMNYGSCDLKDSYIDMTLDESYHYTEFQKNVYTNNDLLSKALTNSGISENEGIDASLPYDFIDFGCDPLIYGDRSVKNIKYNRHDGTSSQICYDSETNNYSVQNGLSNVTDALNGNEIKFANCFVLFADSVIYDNSKCSQMVMDTVGGGEGFYFSQGGILRINWTATQDGVMNFTLDDGSKLVINRGNVYLTFLKTSLKDKILFE